MRAAKSNDIWRVLFRRQDRKLLSLNIQYTNVVELGSGSLSFSHPINLICGENGVGKSAAIWTLVKGLGLDGNLDGSHKISRPKAESGTVNQATLKIRSNEATPPAEKICTFRDLIDTGAPPAVLIDPGLQVPHLLTTLRKDANLLDLLEGVQPITIAGIELQQIRELAGKDYGVIQIYEIEDYAELPVFPYFVVNYGGHEYDSLKMGLGEFSLLYMYWKMRGLPPETLILLEEPESFAAPRSQRALIDYIASISNEKGHFFIISSHSGVIAERIPNDAIQLCARNGQQVTFTSNPAPHMLVDRIAFYLRRRFAALVEDHAAKAFCRALAEHLDPRVAADLDIFIAGSNGEIGTALKTINPDSNERLLLIGVYDGDQRNSLPNDLKWPAICLPGASNPDHTFRELVQNTDKNLIAQGLGIPLDLLINALSGLEGTDNHDWTNRLCQAIDISLSQLFRKLAPMWVAANERSAKVFQMELRRSLKLV
ncbi:ATP-dependent nuclease [Acidovorax delafieldii]|uniref:ATP-dependent nuclease n=1 Tax=Acidovorax delafieldii TaxID=47920 RepID=UPI003ECF52AB